MSTGESSREVVQVSDQIGHRLRLDLEARHGWCFTADDLVHQHGILALICDPNKFGTHKALTGEAMATGAVDAEQLSAMFCGALQIQAGADVGILAAYTIYFLFGEQKQIRPPKGFTHRNNTSDQA